MPSISGTVFITNVDAAPNTDVIVTAYDIDLINKQLLGEVILPAPFRNTSQTFEIRYSSQQYQSAEGRGKADIQVEANTLDGLLAGETQIIFNARDEVTNVRLELRPVENPASEFERLVETLMLRMEGVELANLTSQQIAFLANDSEERRSRILTLHEAASLTRDTGLPIEAGYGWWRRLGQPHTLAGLLEQDEGLLRNTLVGAIRSNIIPDSIDIDDVLAQLNGLRTRVVFGTFTFDPPSQDLIESGVIVQAFDRDFRSEELLGETQIAGPFGPPGSSQIGNYRIEYTEAQFQKNEARTADIIVRGGTVDERYNGESSTLFNAGPEERINLTLIATAPPDIETPDLSELEQLQTDLEPIRENVPYADFTDDDLQFLAQELRQPNSRVELATLEHRLDFLRTAAQYEQTISIPLAAFYGWFRQTLPTALAALLDIPTPRLQAVLEIAILDAIIPDITAQIPGILDAIRAGRLEQGRLVNHRFVAQLINAQTNQALGNILADVTDLDADPDDQDSGIVTVDGQGILVLDFVLPGDAPADAFRRLQLTLRDEERTLATVEVDAIADQTEVVQILVTIEPTAEEQTPIRGLASPTLTARLSDLGIATIDDLLSNPTLPEAEDDDELIQLRDRAKIAVLNPDLTEEQQTYLLDNGLASPQAIARIGRAEFVRTHSDGVGGDAAAYSFYKANQDLVKVMHHQVAGNWLEVVTSPDDEDDDAPDIPGGISEIIEEQTNRCGCEDCTSAVSPAAYLAYLLDWMLTHIKYQGNRVAFADFVSEFHQPFGQLPTHCEAVTQEVRQVRLAVESLWRYIDRLNETDLQLPTPFRNAYRYLRSQLYKAILTNLGVSFEQLRRATLTIEEEGLTADQVAAQRTAAASILGVSEIVLPELFINVDRPAINASEELLETLFGYQNTRKSYQDLFAGRQLPQLISWQRERLESQWQIRDWTADDYSGTGRLPYIDPALIDETYLRTPLAPNSASTLLAERQTQLANHRQVMVESTSTDLAGLDALLEGELSQSIDQLQAWFMQLQGEGGESAVADASDAIAALYLTPAGFSHLMEIRTMLANDESLGDTTDEIEAVWNSVFDILSHAFRHQQFDNWVQRETNDDIVFGPKLFWPAIEPLEINPWLASEGEQAAWLAALEHRSQPPIIDPDQIPQMWVLVLRVAEDNQTSEEEQNSENSFTAGIGSWAIETSLDAFELWERRRAFVDERIADLGLARQSATNSLDALGEMLTASNTGLTTETLLELREQEAAGEDIAPRLDQLTLARSPYRFLVEVHILAEADTSIPTDMWDSAEAILVQVEKQREFADWRNQEQYAQITLHPNQFQILTPPDKVAETVRSEWLHDPRVLNRWVATLEARKDQFKTLETALANVVSAAEGQILMQLRDLLISDSSAPGDSFLEKAEWLDKRLLIDMFMDGCHMTTRVSQAIETLQRLVGGVYTQEHVGTLLDDFALDAVEDYEAEWPVMGAYATWRAYMLAYLFPENLLHLSPYQRESYGFSKYIKKSSIISPSHACEIANQYGDYFRDVSNLTVQASCQLQTLAPRDEKCEGTTLVSIPKLHLFALATTSNKVYWASFDVRHTERDTMTSWRPISGLENVTEIIGSVPHVTPAEKTFLLLFVKVREGNSTKLKYKRYDVGANNWWKLRDLDLPSKVGNNFTAVAIQKRYSRLDSTSFPTLFVVRDHDGMLYLRAMNKNASNWSGEDWKPLISKRQKKRFSELNGMVQQTNSQCLLFLTQKEDNLKTVAYRRINKNGQVLGDAQWHTTSLEGKYLGAFPWLRSNDIFCFWEDVGYTQYRRIGELSETENTAIFDGLLYFSDNFLESLFGISLKDFTPEDFNPRLFAPAIPNYSDGPIAGLTTNHGIEVGQIGYLPYSGSLYDLLDGGSKEIAFSPSEDNPPARLRNPGGPDGANALYYGIQLEWLAINRVFNFLNDIDNADPSNITRWSWKLANDYCKTNSKGNKSLAEIIAQLRDIRVFNVLTELSSREFDDLYKGDRYPLYKEDGLVIAPDSVEITYTRESSSSAAQIASSDEWEIVPIGGHERHGNARVAVAVEMPNGAFRMKLSRSGDGLIADKLYRIDPRGNGLSNLSPALTINELQERRSEIKYRYDVLTDSPPSVISYLKEAFNLMPIYLGRELQRLGFYEEALTWLQQVFDYRQVAGKRKIDRSLKLEQSLKLSYNDAEEWLDNASNPHAIAATRKNSYTRHILLLIIRCLIDYADALFARDNVTDNSRARDLYSQAIELLDFKVLKSKKSDCENILGELDVEIEEAGQLPLQQFQAVIAEISDPARLRIAVDNLRDIAWDTSSDRETRVEAMRAAISEGWSSVRSEATELPPAKSLSIIVEQDKPQIYATLEAQYLSNSTPRSQFRKVNQQRKQTQLTALATVTDISQDAIPWLRQARSAQETDNQLSIAVLKSEVVSRLTVLDQIRQTAPLQSLVAQQFSSFAINTGVSFSFCIPQNPVIAALRRRAENNLTKLRTCRNIAGFLRQIDPYGAPITIGSGMVSANGRIFSGVIDAPPTPYRYAALIARAKELVNIAQQIESGYQSSLEAAEREALSVLQAEQNVELAGARVELQNLRLNQANSQLGLATLQRGSAELRANTFQSWLDAGLNEHENNMLIAYREAGEAQAAAAIVRATAQSLQAATAAVPSRERGLIGNIINASIQGSLTGLAITEGAFNVQAIRAQTQAQISSAQASFERRQNEWQLQQGLAAQDILIGDQQIQIARDGIAITQQERAIAELEQTHAANILQFLLSKTFTEEMYRWIASVLEDVYRYFLQEASAIALLAEQQLIFEQQLPLKIIRSDYWNVPIDNSPQADNRDRLGLTGSARLLKDIYQLDQYAFDTRQLKQSVSVTLDLAELFPFEFQQFRETGILIFETPQSLIDRQFPGYYLCLIQQVTISVVALIPTDGIRASLNSAGNSQTVVGGDTFQTLTLRQLPERLALTSPTTSSGQVLELQPDAQALQRPFEGTGFATQWELRMPKATNLFDYNTIATVLFTVDFTALHSFDYEQQVIEQLDRNISANRSLRFRSEFADAWYDLNNPDQTDTPMVVRFQTRREDFPPNVSDLRIQHLILYFIRKDGETFEVPVRHLHITEQDTVGTVGGSAQSIDGVISTRRGNGTSWLPMIGKSPYGEWELAFSDEPETVLNELRVRDLFDQEVIEDMLLVITYQGQTPAYPNLV